MLYADNGNGRLAPATQVLFDAERRRRVAARTCSDLVTDGLAFNVGDNAGGTDTFLKLADQASPAAMTIGTSARARHGDRGARAAG